MTYLFDQRAVWIGVTVLLLGLGYGCGLGYLEPAPPPSALAVRIENNSGRTVEITLKTAPLIDDEGNPVTLAAKRTRQAQTRLSADATIRVDHGSRTTGALLCDSQVLVTARGVDGDVGTVTLLGDGTGTAGFDSGTVGLNGERVLLNSVDFACEDFLLVRITDQDRGEVWVVSPHEADPEPLEDGAEGTDERLSVRVENATATDARVVIGGTGVSPVAVQVPAGEFTFGEVDCGVDYEVSGTLGEAVESIQFSGEGTGTPGFDSGSVGETGERILVSGQHYRCGQTVVVRVTDDGSGVGSSVSETPTGTVSVYLASQVPDPILPDVDNEGDGDPGDNNVETVRVRIRNQTGSFVQIKLTSGAGGTENQVDVRVPPVSTSDGSIDCAQRLSIEANHLETADSDEGSGFHTVILLGDGTGADGFDENNIGTDDTRLLIQEQHYACGNLIEITIQSTGNTFDADTNETVFGIGQAMVEVSE